jgi:hypothetical protein
MKHSFALILLIISTTVFSMPCPTNDQIITKGDALENVIEKCGSPASRKDSVLTIPILQKWTYYKPHSYDQNYAKLTILIKNNSVLNLTVNDNNVKNNVSSTIICGQTIQVGYNGPAVLSACGNPANKEDLQTDIVPIAELFYSSTPPQTLKFVRGQLTEWE